jgi:calcium-dependent protein kinase
MKTIAGTPYYMAPEVLQGKYGMECDVWSTGVLLYLLLSGLLPFGGESRTIIFDKISEGRYTFEKKEFKNISEEAKDLIRLMLVVQPKKRVTAAQALKHKWF